MEGEAIEIPARDGVVLQGRSFGDLTGPVVLINSATATPQRFYRHFATALAQAGLRAITYDYRGIGASREGSLRGFTASMRDWAFLDMAGAVDWAAAQSKDRVLLIGHSFGGQVAGMLEEPQRIAGLLTLSAQSGHWRLQGKSQRLPVWLHTHLSLPALTHLMGYMPWSWFGGEDLPKAAALEWARWCRDPKYLLGDDSLPLERYAQFQAPVLAFSIEDDNWGTAPSVDAMMGAYPNMERRHVDPRDHGLKGLGHFGYFKPPAKGLWDEAIAWLRAQGRSIPKV